MEMCYGWAGRAARTSFAGLLSSGSVSAGRSSAGSRSGCVGVARAAFRCATLRRVLACIGARVIASDELLVFNELRQPLEQLLLGARLQEAPRCQLVLELRHLHLCEVRHRGGRCVGGRASRNTTAGGRSAGTPGTGGSSRTKKLGPFSQRAYRNTHTRRCTRCARVVADGNSLSVKGRPSITRLLDKKNNEVNGYLWRRGQR